MENLRDREPLRADAVALDPRRRDALRPDEEVVEVAAAGPDPLVRSRKHGQCVLGGRRRGRSEWWQLLPKLVGDVRLVSAGRPVAATQPVGVLRVPEAFDGAGHHDLPICVPATFYFSCSK